MPIYEYECDKCSHHFEREQSISDPPVKTCPKCRGRKVTKLISRSSFVLKGGGWYADGYSDSKGGGSGSGDAGSGSGSDTSSASGSDSKSESGSKPSGGDAKSGGGDSKSGKADSKTSKAKKNAA